MRSLLLIFVALIASKGNSMDPASTLINEFNQIEKWAKDAQPDGVVANLYPFVQKEGYIVLFSEDFNSNHVTIRIFMAQEFPKKDFAVTYIKSSYLYEDRTVLRRFIGHEPTGWINHTIDWNTGEYLGSQGYQHLKLAADEQAILDEWGIQLNN